MAPLLTQLRTVLWRNILVKRRGWKRTTLETLAPVLLVAVMALIRLGVHTHEYTHQTSRLPPHDISTPMFAPHHSITASPALRVTADIMDHVIDVLNVTSLSYQLHDDVLSEQAELSYLDNRNMTDVGVGFLLGNSSGKVLVEGYVIRMPHEDHHYVTSDCSFRNSMETCARSTDGLTTECPGSQPLLSGLLRLQWAVETVLTQKFWDPGFKPPALQVQMMPMPFYKPGVTNMQLLVALSMVIALTPLAYCVTATMVTEKKKWAKVMLKILGVSDSVFWISWWLTYLVVVVVAGGLAAVLVAASGVLDGPGVGYFYLLLLLYGASLLGLGSVVAVFFKTPKLAGCACSVLSILLGMLHMCVSLTRPSKWSSSTNSGDPMTQSSVPFGGQLVFSFLSPTAFALGIDRLVFDNEENVRADILSGQFPLLAVVLMLILDCGLYGLLAVYLDTVVSDHDRLTQTACFFLKPSFWRPRRDDEVRDAPPHDTPEGPHLEPLPESLDDRRVIRIRDLSKSFSSGGKERMHGLDGLDLDIVEGQVTCILGHSGSGKTTLMKILAGVTAPSRGAAFIGNLNVSCIRDQKELTSVVTFCPQCDFVLGDLTVEEHMHISGRLRGVPSDSLQHEIGSILDTFHLDKDRGTMVWKLTGCQRRRLSLAMAFLVDTKVILLDEPTLGLEADERRHLLRLLHSKKEGRVIVFTSRHMDEADYYSDRKIVISQGHLRCVGSSDFLKQYFNVGYRLNLEVHEATNTERLMRVVRSHVRDASLLHRRDNYLTVAVPLLQAGKLTVLLRQLESNERGAEYLGVARFGITLTTLEQLFWKLGEEEAAGCVFISPHLMPAQEPTFIGEDLSTPGSMHPSRRWTGSISHDDQSSATAFLQRRHTESSMSQHGKPGARNRALSTFLTRFANPRGSDVSHHSPCSGRPAESSSRHSKSSRSKSLAMIIPTRKGSSAGHAPHDLEYRPGFDGNNYGNIERRRTVATFQDARSLAQQNLIGMPPDPMAKLRALDSYEQVQKAALADMAEETAESSDAGPDPENAPAPPLKMGEVLAGLQAPKKGVCLDLQRLAAMLRLRVLIRVSEKWWVLLRVVLTVLLTVAALGTSHALLPEAEWSSRQKERLPLFGRHPLFYTNSSGDPVDSLLANLSRSGHELVHVSDLEALDYPSNMQSVLDIMESNGSVYRLHYNASCAMALPQLISILAGVDRNYSDAAPTTPNSNSSIGLAPTVSAWLQPWPTVTRHENRGVLDWVPVLFLGLALVVSVSTFAVTLISERKKRLRRYVDVIGVTRWMYYGTAVTIDVLEFALPATFLVILCAVSKMAIFEAEGSVYSLAVLVVLYMGAGVLWMYALSFLLSSGRHLALLPHARPRPGDTGQFLSDGVHGQRHREVGHCTSLRAHCCLDALHTVWSPALHDKSGNQGKTEAR
ncbi:cholesterol transporter ABCA5-like [Babylonia areolata]|uniref:cholesterol transporter ABCA5-like n=1 Tax=Babylonia areolata TaxID=304850 RepID=UPI003FCFEE12